MADRISALEARIRRLEVALITALVWSGGSANSPLSGAEVKKIVDMIEP